MVRLEDNARKEFGVKQLTRKRAANAGRDSMDLVKEEFDKAVHSAMSFLAPEAPVPLADGPAEGRGEEEHSDLGQE